MTSKVLVKLKLLFSKLETSEAGLLNIQVWLIQHNKVSTKP